MKGNERIEEVETIEESGKERTQRKRNIEKPVPHLDRSKYFKLDATQRILRLRFPAARQTTAVTATEKVLCDDKGTNSSPGGWNSVVVPDGSSTSVDNTAPPSQSQSSSSSLSPSPSPSPLPSPPTIIEISQKSKQNTPVEGIPSPSTFHGTTKDRTMNTKRKVSSWCWVQAPDGSPATVDSTAPSFPSQSPSPLPQPTIRDASQESELKNPVEGIPSPSTFHGNAEDRNMSFKRKVSRWCWVQTPDGRPATVEITAPSSPSSSAAAVSSSSSSSRLTIREVSQESELKNPVKGIPSPSDFHGDTNHRYMSFKRKVRSWRWVQTSHGSPATIENTAVAAAAPPPPTTKLTIRKVSQISVFPVEGIPSPSAFHASTKDRKINSKRRVRGWYWLLAGDGSSNTMDSHTKLTTKNPQICSHGPRRKAKKSDYYIRMENDKVPSEIEMESSVSDDFESSGNSDNHVGNSRSSSSSRRVRARTTTEIRQVGRHQPPRKATRPAYFIETESGMVPSKIQMEDSVWDESESGDYGDDHSDSQSFVHSRELNTEWRGQFRLLVEYKTKHKTTDVPQSDRILGTWVRTQRIAYQKNELPEYRFQRLNSIGFVWEMERADSWMKWYNCLLSYKDQHCDSTNVPNQSSRYPDLAQWVERQRVSNGQGKLPIEQFVLLDSIGFQWDPFLHHWMEMYERLVAYKRKHCTTCVSEQFKEDHKLRNWVNKQRYSCKWKHRVELLNDIGFEWIPRIDRRKKIV